MCNCIYTVVIPTITFLLSILIVFNLYYNISIYFLNSGNISFHIMYNLNNFILKYITFTANLPLLSIKRDSYLAEFLSNINY